MTLERGEGGRLVLRWNMASTLTIAIAVGAALFGISAAAVFAEIPATMAMLPVVVGAGLAAVLLVRRVTTSTWTVGQGEIACEGSLFRSGRRWPIRPGAEVVLTHRLISGRNAHEKWGVSVVGGEEEIRLGERASAEAEVRRIGEALARELRVPLRYGPGGLAILPEDLDLPFVERLAKYPALRAEPQPRPEGIGIREELLGTSRVFRWRALNLFTLLAVAGMTLFALLYAAGESPTVGRWLLGHPEWALVLLGVPLVVLVGLGFRLSAGPQGVEFEIALYGIPLRSRRLSASELEEVRFRKVVNTPTLQLASDREVIRCRVYRWKSEPALRWLAGEVQLALAGSLGASRLTTR